MTRKVQKGKGGRRRTTAGLNGDPERRRKVEAAIRHAESVARSSAVVGPVIFRPGASPKRRGSASPESAPRNNAIEIALRHALGLPEKAKTSKPTPPPQIPDRKQTAATSRNVAAFAGPKQETVKKVAAGKPKLPKRPKPAAQKQGTPTPRKRTKAKKQASQPGRRPINARVAEISVAARREAAQRNGASRRAFNAQQRAGGGGGVGTPISPFAELRRRWQHAFEYLQKFGHATPDAPDIVAARDRLLEIEAEWEHRSGLPPEHPDYFAWPSTDAPSGDGSIGSVDWFEMGMLGYLGYHVGLASDLSELQRARLLERVFLMRLPPFNSVAYMRSWGAPDTSVRLRKMAESLASFARNKKRSRTSKYAVAVSEWEADLAFLRRAFYVGRFDFPWPVV